MLKVRRDGPQQILLPVEAMACLPAIARVAEACQIHSASERRYRLAASLTRASTRAETTPSHTWYGLRSSAVNESFSGTLK